MNRFAEEASLEMKPERTVYQRPTTRLEQRTLILLRARYGREDFSDDEFRVARSEILDEMATDVLRGSMQTGARVKQMLQGHLNYYAASGNHSSMWWFCNQVQRLWLKTLQMLQGHLNYYTVSGNHSSMLWFCNHLQRLWKALRRRSQKADLSWECFFRLVERFFPPTKTPHPPNSQPTGPSPAPSPDHYISERVRDFLARTRSAFARSDQMETKVYLDLMESLRPPIPDAAFEPTVGDAPGDVETAVDDLTAEPSSQLLGWRLLNARPQEGLITVGFDGKREFCDLAGFVQGGLLSAMLDSTMGAAVIVMSEGRLYTSMVRMTVNFRAPAMPGPIVAEAKVTQLGKTLAFVEGKLLAQDGTLLATATCSRQSRLAQQVQTLDPA
jgi:uncharacterized protein (TIGR00369 family)